MSETSNPYISKQLAEAVISKKGEYAQLSTFLALLISTKF